MPPTKDLVSPSTVPEPRNWHELHCDPIMDVVLVSRDKVYFRASSHALKRESSLFKGMLSSFPNQYQTESDAIPLDSSAAAIALFLDIYSSPTPIQSALYQTLDFPTLHEHRKLILYLDCDRLSPATARSYETACEDKPWERLILASKELDYDGARAALNRCRENGSPLYWENIFVMLNDVRPEWRYNLLEAFIFPDGTGPEASTTCHFAKWPDDEMVYDLILPGECPCGR